MAKAKSKSPSRKAVKKQTGADNVSVVSPELPSGVSVEIAEFRYSGPVPHPEILRGYNDIAPDMADRVLRISEKEQDARLSVNEKIISTDRLRIFGSIFISFSLIVAGVICASIGQPFLGFTFGLSGIFATLLNFLKKYLPSQ